MGCHVPRLAKNICNVVGRVRFPYGPHKRFVGVTANISDCLSDAMSSILIRTAVLPDSVMVNTSDFDSDILSSSLSLATKHVGFSLFGKASVCATEEQGSSPGVNQYG